MFGKPEFADINSHLNARFEEKAFLIAQHRGAGNGDIVENTLLAYKTSLLLGADLFELDVSRSTDGALYCFHDTTERKNLRISQNIESLSSAEIAELTLYNSIWEPSEFKVPLLEDIFRCFTHGELFNIDRGWNKFDDVFRLMDRYPHVIKQAIIKCPAETTFLEKVDGYKTKFMFMPIVRNLDDIERVFSYRNLNLVGFELIFDREDCDLLRADIVHELNRKGYFCWVNAIKLSGKATGTLSAGLDDNLSIDNGFDQGWGRLLSYGFTVIQTDWPELLSKYRESMHRL